MLLNWKQFCGFEPVSTLISVCSWYTKNFWLQFFRWFASSFSQLCFVGASFHKCPTTSLMITNLCGARTRRFITAFTRARYLSLSWANWIYCTFPAKYIQLQSPHLCFGLPSGLFPSGFLTKTLYTFLSYSMRDKYPAHLILLDLICLMAFWERVQNMKLLIEQLPLFSCYFIPLRSKYSPQNPLLKHPQLVLFPSCERSSFTPI
jgi:hypothetical protein